MRTYSARPEAVERNWVVIDAENKVLGRLATEIARRLRGKHKPEYTPHVDTGDYVVVVNARKVHTTGNKSQQKNYYRHTGRPGSLKEVSFEEMREAHPERIITHAVRGMMPKNRLGRSMLSKLRVYPGPEHRHEAQNPEKIEI